MSIKLVKNEVLRFLNISDPEVICISGKWGVGKTYAWNRYLVEAVNNRKVAKDFNSYAYISLFGQNSLQEVRNSIFPSTVSIEEIQVGPTTKTFADRLKSISGKWRKLSPHLANIVQEKTSITGLDQLFLLLVKKQIICIDDIERHGQGLDVKDILGLASNLKEEKQCKIVIILNDEVLEGSDLKDFQAQLEKVVDVFLKFEPTPEEAAEISVDKDSSFKETFSQDCIKLGIVNIRVIRKIQRLAYILQKQLSNFDERVFKNALHSLILLGWVVYQPTEAPPIEFIKEHSRYFSALKKKEENEQSEENAKWDAVLNSFGWSHFDEFDLLILESIKRGYFDDEALSSAATTLETSIKEEDSTNSFSKAWDLYHGSFDDNEKEVLDSIYEAFMKNVKIINPTNFDSTVRFFKEFGRPEQAAEMINYYMENHPGNRDFYNLADYSFREEVTDPDVIEAFNKKKDTFTDSRNPVDVLEGIVKHRGWNPQDIDLLSKLTADDFYSIFKNAKGDNRHIVVRGALTFASITNIGEKEKLISSKATEALKKIASESPMNRRRVSMEGLKIDEAEENE